MPGEFGGLAQQHQQHTRRHGVQRAGVPDFFLPQTLDGRQALGRTGAQSACAAPARRAAAAMAQARGPWPGLRGGRFAPKNPRGGQPKPPLLPSYATTHHTRSAGASQKSDPQDFWPDSGFFRNIRPFFRPADRSRSSSRIASSKAAWAAGNEKVHRAARRIAVPPPPNRTATARTSTGPDERRLNLQRSGASSRNSTATTRVPRSRPNAPQKPSRSSLKGLMTPKIFQIHRTKSRYRPPAAAPGP